MWINVDLKPIAPNWVPRWSYPLSLGQGHTTRHCRFTENSIGPRTFQIQNWVEYQLKVKNIWDHQTQNVKNTQWWKGNKLHSPHQDRPLANCTNSELELSTIGCMFKYTHSCPTPTPKTGTAPLNDSPRKAHGQTRNVSHTIPDSPSLSECIRTKS